MPLASQCNVKHDRDGLGDFVMRFGRLALCLGVLVVSATPVTAASTNSDAAPSQATSPMAAMDAAFENAQLAAAPGSGTALAEGAARVAAGDPVLRALVDDSRAAEQQRRALETVLASLRAQGASAAERARGVASDLDRSVAASEAARSRLQSAFPRFLDLVDPEPVSLANARRLLQPHEALVMILPSPRGTYVWALSKDDAMWFRSDLDDAAIAELSQGLLQSVRPGTGRGAVDAARPGIARSSGGFARDAAWRLYSALWAPAAALLKEATTVYVVADGPLRAVPAGVLVTRAPQGLDTDPSALRTTPWFAKDHAFVQLPAVASLRTVRLAPAVAGLGFEGFGDAQTSGYPDDSVGKALAPLPETRRELRLLARLLRADRRAVHLGRDATEHALKTADLERVSVLALATHAIPAGAANETGASEPALVFTPPALAQGENDGILTASEAARLHLGANLVILSACDTAEDDPDSIAINSLSRAFFHAGARALLVSNWRIRDDVASRLSTETLRIAVRDGASLAEASRQASLSMMSDRSDPSFSNPAQWASFSVLGDGSVRF